MRRLWVLIVLSLAACGGGGPSKLGTPVNKAPSANAGADIQGVAGQPLQLMGTGSDTDGQVTAYHWTQVSGPALAKAPADSAQPQITLPTVAQSSTLVLRLTVTDDTGATASDEVTITVAPSITLPSDSGALDAKPNNTDCLAGDRPANQASLQLTRAFAQLPPFSLPILLLQAPQDASRWFVVEQGGRVKVFNNQAGVTSTAIFLDIGTRVYRGASESGLLSIAFHPKFASNGYVYAFYQANTSPLLSKLSRFTSRDGGKTLDASSEVNLLSFTPPYQNHFGGHLGFDAQGYLYLTIGDGGAGGDPGKRAQNTQVWYGKMLRLDVDHGSPYAIPADNPFASSALCVAAASPSNTSCPEIFAWGLRNTWRWSFDRATGDIWAGDVGQGAWEEVDIIKRGGNYGWAVREGMHCYGSANCAHAGMIEPVAEYSHDLGKSITGGFVYRGQEMPDLIGHYVFGDYVSGRIWALFADANGQQKPKELAVSGFNIASFAEDSNGELYLLNYGAGTLHRLGAASSQGPQIPAKLSQTGCTLAGNTQQPASGLIPYALKAPFWSDGAVKQRWFGLPNDKNLSMNTGIPGRWNWPLGAVIVKEFRLGNRLVETRLLKHHNDDTWAGYSYAWNAEQTDADYVPGGAKRSIDLGNGMTQDWIFPSGGDCMQCHNAQSGYVLGPEAAQLDTVITYASTGRSDNQLHTLAAIGVMPSVTVGAALVNPADVNQSLTARARAYLHTNCSQCHRPNGPTDVDMDLRFTTALKDTHLCKAAQNPVQGLVNLMRLQPGDAAKSMLWQRIQRRDAAGMPPLGSTKVDTAGVALLEAWIQQLVSCD